MKEKIQQIYNNIGSLNITQTRQNCMLLVQSMNLLQELYDEVLNNESMDNSPKDNQDGE